MSNELVQYFQDAWSGANSPQGRATLWSAAGATAQVGAAAVAPTIGAPSSAAGMVVAAAPEVARRTYDNLKEQYIWNRVKTPLIVVAVGALLGSIATKSTLLGLLGAGALGGYIYGRSKYGG